MTEEQTPAEKAAKEIEGGKTAKSNEKSFDEIFSLAPKKRERYVCVKKDAHIEREAVFQRLIEAARQIFDWYFIFGEDNQRAKELLANLGNVLEEQVIAEAKDGTK